MAPGLGSACPVRNGPKEELRAPIPAAQAAPQLTPPFTDTLKTPMLSLCGGGLGGAPVGAWGALGSTDQGWWGVQ